MEDASANTGSSEAEQLNAVAESMIDVLRHPRNLQEENNAHNPSTKINYDRGQALGLYKTTLQEYTQANKLPLPIYRSTISGETHCQTFVATVEVRGIIYKGEVSSKKKEAEARAAKVAVMALLDETDSVVARNDPSVDVEDFSPQSCSTSVSESMEQVTPSKRRKAKKRLKGIMFSRLLIPLKGFKPKGKGHK